MQRRARVANISGQLQKKKLNMATLQLTSYPFKKKISETEVYSDKLQNEKKSIVVPNVSTS